MKRTLLREPGVWTYYGKGVLMALVAAATVLETQEVPPWVLITSRCVVGVGAIFGIASSGLTKR